MIHFTHEPHRDGEVVHMHTGGGSVPGCWLGSVLVQAEHQIAPAAMRALHEIYRIIRGIERDLGI